MRGRLAFVLIGLIGIVLLGVMIGLQLLIIVNHDQAAGVNNAQSGQAQATPALTLALATDIPLPTATPLPPTPTFTEAPPSPTPEPSTPAPPLATPLAPTPVPPTSAPPTAAVAAVVATATALPTIALPIATNTPEAPVDLRIGYTERSVDCALISQIVKLVLERQMKLHIATLHFKTTDDLFAGLAATTGGDRVDLTFCYIDPDDRTYLGSYGSSLRFLDGNYGQSGKQKFYAVINSALISRLKTEQPCMHSFLKKLDFGDVQFQGKNAEQWLNDNNARIAAWSQCP
ncbi:MAG: hypothetical protein U0350_41140 [Caldilineaceae bacterium]